MQVLFVIAGVLLASNTVNGFGFGALGGGGGCGCAPPAPPPCLPPPACPPPPVAICAPPPPPPPQPCPPPPPPAPCNCAPPPPPQICGGGCAPPPRPPPPPAQNDCCCHCSDPCKFRKRRIAFAAQTEGGNNPLCNSEKLRKIMRDNMSSSTSVSKRSIQKAAMEKLKGRFDVICAKGDFSYVVNTNFFCQEALNDVTCYAFRQL